VFVLRDYKVVCDASNNSAESIANKELHVDITFAPDELKYQILLRADGAVELVAKYARLGPNWFEVKDGTLGDVVEFI